MAARDWSSTASLNTSVGGINIAEACARANMNDMGRAIMAEAKGGFLEVESVLKHGADPTGAADSTAAFESAFNSGKAVHAPAGTYKLDRCDIPGAKGFEFTGEGHERTILIAGATNQPIFRKELAAGAVQHGRIGGFSMKAHASGSTGTAFDCSGFRDMTFYDIRGLSNGSLGFESLFDVSASPYLTYGCVWDKCGLAEQTGWTNVWLFNNRSAGAASNSNSNTIRDPWIYANTGLTYGIDAARSAMTSIIGGLIEANSGATAIRMGQGTHVRGIWFEGNAADIAYGALADGTANTSTVEYCYFSDAHNVSFTSVVGNLWLHNIESGAQTFTNNDGTNLKHNPVTAIPSAPTIARTAGTTGDPSLVSATRSRGPDLFGRITWHLRHTVTPAAATYQTLTITPPTGYVVELAVVGAIRDSNGVPATFSPGPEDAGTTCNLGYAGADAHSMNSRITIRPT